MQLRASRPHGHVDAKRITAQYAQRESTAENATPRENARRIPLGNEGTPEDVASMIGYLASDAARYITGAEFTVDGGWRLLR